jgi:hypothetical protein
LVTVPGPPSTASSATCPARRFRSTWPAPKSRAFARLGRHHHDRALDVTLFSYNGSLDFGLIACREMVPDVWNLIGHRNDALAELVKLST